MDVVVGVMALYAQDASGESSPWVVVYEGWRKLSWRKGRRFA